MQTVEVPGVGAVSFPDGMSQEQIVQAIERDILPRAKKPPPETSALRDIGGGLVRGVGQIGSGIGALAGLPFGTINNALTRGGKALEDYGAGLQSEGMRDKERALSDRMEAVKNEGLIAQGREGLLGLVSDPYLMAGKVVEQVPSLIGTLGGGLAARALGRGAIMAAERTAGVKAAEELGSRYAVRGAIGTGAALQTGSVTSETYDDVMGLDAKVLAASPAYTALRQTMTDQEAREALATRAAREAALIAAPASVASAALLPGVERQVFGKQAKAALIGRILKGFVAEGAQEGIEEGAGRFGQNVGARRADTEREMTQGVGTAAAQGALLGGIMGGGVNAIAGRSPDPAAPRLDPEVDRALRTMATNQEPPPDLPLALPGERPDIETAVGNMTRSQADRYFTARFPALQSVTDQAERIAIGRNLVAQEQAAIREGRQGEEEGRYRGEIATSPETQQAFREVALQQDADRRTADITENVPLERDTPYAGVRRAEAERAFGSVARQEDAGQRVAADQVIRRDLADVETRLQGFIAARDDARSRLAQIERSPTLDAVAREAAQAEIAQLDQMILGQEQIRRQLANQIPQTQRDIDARANMQANSRGGFDVAGARRDRAASQAEQPGVEIEAGVRSPDTLPPQTDDLRAGAPQRTAPRYVLNPEFQGGRLVGGEAVVDVTPANNFGPDGDNGFGRVLAWVQRPNGNIMETVPVETTLDQLYNIDQRETPRMTQDSTAARVGPEQVAGSRGRAVDPSGVDLTPRRTTDRTTEFSAQSARQDQPAPAPTPVDPAAVRSENRDKAMKVINNYLERYRKMGTQGRLIRNSLINALKDGTYTYQQLYSAFVVADQIATVLPAGANHRIEFLKYLTADDAAAVAASGGAQGTEAQGARIRPMDEALGVIQISLSPKQLPLVEQTGWHEAFHVLQDYYARFDPKFADGMNKGFAPTTTLDGQPALLITDIDPSLRRKLSSLIMPGTKISYMDDLTRAFGDRPLSVREAQAYAFGALADASRRGMPITGTKPAFVRFVDMLKSLLGKVGNAVRGDGFTDVASLMEDVSRGDAQRFTQAAPTATEMAGMPGPALDYSARGMGVDPEEFAKWWTGGWGATTTGPSKAAHPDGSPLVLFHGTSKDAAFKRFKAGPRGVWFTTDPKEASSYAEDNDSRGVKYDYASGDFKKVNTASRVMPVYLSMQNPATPTQEQADRLSGKVGGANYARTQAAVFAEMRAAGHDGVQLPGGVWVAFDPRQIKSVFNPFARNTATSQEFSARSAPDLMPGDPGSPEWASAVNAGLDMSYTARMQRAQELGYTQEAYHLTAADFTEFRVTSSRDFGIHVGTADAANAIAFSDSNQNMLWVARENLKEAQADRTTSKKEMADIQQRIAFYEIQERLAYQDKRVLPLLINRGVSVRLPDVGNWAQPLKFLNSAYEEKYTGGTTVYHPVRENELPQEANDEITKWISGDNLKNLYDQAGWREFFPQVLKKYGIDSVVYRNLHEGRGADSYLLWEPNRVRSVFAAFNPALTDKGDIGYSARQVNTPAFKNWFGDSKIVDAEGNPLVLYRGLRGEFIQDVGGMQPRDRYASFFSTSPYVAATYGNMDSFSDGAENTGAIFPAYIKAGKLLEFPVNNGRFDFFKFDIVASRLQPGEALVARGVVDIGPRASRAVDPEANYSYPSDVYAIGKGTSVKSATGNSGAFDPATPRIEASARTPLSFDTTFNDYRERLTGRDLDKPHVLLQGLRKFAGAAPGESIRSALVRNTINRAAPLWLLDRVARDKGLTVQSAGLAMEVALNDTGRVQMLIDYGPMAYDPISGDVVMREDVPGLLDIFRGRVDPRDKKFAQTYFIALRERDLRAKGRKGFVKFGDKEIADIIARAEAQHPEWRDVASDLQRVNAALLDFAVDTGTLDRAKADELALMFYTPFYRFSEDDTRDDAGTVVGPRVSASLANIQTAFDKALKGGEDPVGDLFENIIRNADAIMKAGMKNVAMRTAAQTMEMVGIGRAAKAKEPGKTITYRVNGQDKHFEVDDAVIFTALAGTPREFQGGIYQTMANMAGFFRSMITAAPGFMLANLWRGKIMAYVQEGSPLWTNTADGLRQALKGSSSLKAISAQTGFGGYAYGMGDANQAAALEAQLGGGGPMAQLWRRTIEPLQKFSEATEFAERIKLAERMKAQGMTDKQAAFQAYLLAPFSRRGMGGGWAGATVNWLVPLVPFLNAKIQGLYRLYENEKADKQSLWTAGIPKQIFMRGLVTMGLSLAIAAKNMYDEPEKWDALTPDLKMRYDVIIAGDKRIMLPRPFEVGTFFGAIPTFLVDAVRKEDGSDLAKMLTSAGLSTFFFNPLPQAIVPIIGAATNYDFFRGRELDTKGDLSLPAEERATPNTSSVAKGIGQAAGMSPIRVQYLIEGYSGSIGAKVLAGIDVMMAKAGMIPGKPSGAFGDPTSPVALAAGLVDAGRFYRDEAQMASRFVGEFYKVKEQADQLQRALNRAKEVGDVEALKELAGEKGLPLRLRPVINAASQQLESIQAMTRKIRASDLSPDEMARRLAPLTQRRDAITQRVMERARTLGVQP